MSSTDNITNLKTPTLTGTSEAGATVAVYNGTTKVGTGIAGADGAWTITTSAMGNGAQSMTTKATDAAGNVSIASGALTIGCASAVRMAKLGHDVTLVEHRDSIGGAIGFVEQDGFRWGRGTGFDRPAGGAARPLPQAELSSREADPGFPL